jgi:hypothetical protein
MNRDSTGQFVLCPDRFAMQIKMLVRFSNDAGNVFFEWPNLDIVFGEHGAKKMSKSNTVIASEKTIE